MRTALALAFVASGALRADGLTYRFRTDVQGVLPRSLSGTVWIDGARARIELAAGPAKTACLRDPSAKDTCRNLDFERKTYYRVACAAALSMADGATHTFGRSGPPGFVGKAGTPKRDHVLIEEADLGPGEEIAGLPTRGFTLRVSWTESLRIGPDDVRVELKRTLEVWASDRVSQRAFQYGHADELLAVPDEARATLDRRLADVGFPLKYVVISTRKFDRGEPTVETLTTVLNGVRTARPDSSLFEVPAGFRYEEPLVGAPSR
jgi:hypothetical protein